MIKNCMIKNCRYPMSHTSMGHLCGSCRKFGHGIIECNKPNLINNILDNYSNDEIPFSEQCSFSGCLTRQYHMNDAHHCMNCFQRNHSENTCPTNTIIKNFNICCPICRTNNIILSTQQKIKGLTDQCVICMELPTEIFLPNCGHVCICIKCAQRLDTNK